jgi:hypothetical protein
VVSDSKWTRRARAVRRRQSRRSRNPFAKRAGALRKAFYATATEADLQAIARQVVEQAKAGNLGAIKIELLWLLGKPAEPTNLDVPAPTAQAF